MSSAFIRHFPKKLTALFALACLSACAGGSAAKPQVAAAPQTTPTPPKTPTKLPTMLVMPLKCEAGQETAARALDEMILAAVQELSRYQVVGPSDLNALLGVEKLKDAMGCDDVSCAAEIGGALGAPFLLAGQLGKLGDQATLSLRLMDAQAPAVLKRSMARGLVDANSLAQMTATAVGTIFNVEIKTPTVTAVPSPKPAVDYSAFQAITMSISRRMANQEYSAMLTDLDTYAKQKIESPPGTDLDELLTMYRATACYTLKRNACMSEAVKKYQTKWPHGLYASTLQNYAEQIEDAALQKDAKQQELSARLAEIAESEKKGAFTPDLAAEMVAYAYFGAQQYERAATEFKAIYPKLKTDVRKALDISRSWSFSLAQLGRFDEARKVLTDLQALYPTQFRLEGLNNQLRLLPQ